MLYAKGLFTKHEVSLWWDFTRVTVAHFYRPVAKVVVRPEARTDAYGACTFIRESDFAKARINWNRCGKPELGLQNPVGSVRIRLNLSVVWNKHVSTTIVGLLQCVCHNSVHCVLRNRMLSRIRRGYISPYCVTSWWVFEGRHWNSNLRFQNWKEMICDMYNTLYCCAFGKKNYSISWSDTYVSTLFYLFPLLTAQM